MEETTGLAEWINAAVAGRLFSESVEIQKSLIGTGEGYRARWREIEAAVGIEPAYTALQAAA